MFLTLVWSPDLYTPSCWKRYFCDCPHYLMCYSSLYTQSLFIPAAAAAAGHKLRSSGQEPRFWMRAVCPAPAAQGEERPLPRGIGDTLSYRRYEWERERRGLLSTSLLRLCSKPRAVPAQGLSSQQSGPQVNVPPLLRCKHSSIKLRITASATICGARSVAIQGRKIMQQHLPDLHSL